MSPLVVYIIFGIAILLMVIGVLRMLDWYAIFNRFYGNNPHKGKIYVDFGENEQYCDGELVGSDDRFLFYNYQMGNREFTVAVPYQYQYIFVRGRRKICVDYGNEFAKPITYADARVSIALQPQNGASVLNASIKKKLAVDMVNSVESRKGIKLSLIIILLAVAIGGFIIYRTMIQKPETNQPVENNNPAPTQTIKPEDLPYIIAPEE
jgi:hypothetical protein